MRGEDEEPLRLLEAIAAGPRATGSTEEKRARDYCAAFLRANGFSTSEERFSFSAFAGLVATPLAGAVLASMFSLLCWYGAVASRDGTGRPVLEPGVPVAILAAHLLLLVFIGMLATSRSILHLPWLRRSGVNLVARPAEGGAAVEPRLWLMAHLDSKSQPISILARAAGVTVSAILLAVTIPMAVAQYAFEITMAPALWVTMGVLGVLASVPLLLSVVSNRSPGALDNASGVVAILMAAAALTRRGGATATVGVVITTAEELGLAGAHAWSAGRQPGLAINCDSVDDAGKFLCFGGPGGAPARSRSRREVGIVQMAIRSAAGANETPVYERRRLLGILVDSMALEARGWDTVTLSRGTLGSLRRIHTAADTRASCTGLGSAAAAILIRDASSAILARV